MAEDTGFFQVGGTLEEGARSYIERPADRELLEFLSRGELCMVLSPRQTGKSSLMVHAMAQLKVQGIRSGCVDLQPMGGQSDQDVWFGDLVYQLERSLGLTADSGLWWEEHKRLGATQRFMTFLEDVVLKEIKGKVVIFFDEIDSVLPLAFSDDFFTTLRALMNARANNPVLRRLTFVLLGVATPSDFIKNKTRTPFNIGREIRLGDFDPSSLSPFTTILGQGSKPLVERIFYWTEGHPLMIQKLAGDAYSWKESERSLERVDEVVQGAYLATRIDKDTHLKFTSDYLLRDKKKNGKILKIYKDVLAGKPIPHDEQSPEHATLTLAGVVRVDNRQLVCRNPVYKTIFNTDWVRKNTPRNTARTVAYGSSSLLVLVLLWFFILQPLFSPEFKSYQKNFWSDHDIYYTADDEFYLDVTLPDQRIKRITVDGEEHHFTEPNSETKGNNIRIPFKELKEKDTTIHVIRYHSGFWGEHYETRLVIAYFPEDHWMLLDDLKMVSVMEGRFEMGCGSWSGSCEGDERSLHEVYLDNFKIGKYEITQSQWVKLMGYNPAYNQKGGNYPVENVSWEHVREFIRRLRKQTGKNYALPTEAQWEYAARSGGKHELFAGGNNLDSLGWYRGNSQSNSHETGLKAPNGLGIHDMSGNVWEWCSDWYSTTYYDECREKGVVKNPRGPEDGSLRVLRGGGWSSNAEDCRTADRGMNGPGNRHRLNGFRLVLLSGQ